MKKIISYFSLLFLSLILAPSVVLGGSATATFNVQSNVVPACTVSANDLNFGDIPLINSLNVFATSIITVNCPVGLGYWIGISEGLHPGGPGARHMAEPGGVSGVLYLLSKTSDRTDIWTQTDPDILFSSGTGSAQTHTVYGTATVTSGTRIMGAHSDVVTVSVNY